VRTRLPGPALDRARGTRRVARDFIATAQSHRSALPRLAVLAAVNAGARVVSDGAERRASGLARIAQPVLNDLGRNIFFRHIAIMPNVVRRLHGAATSQHWNVRARASVRRAFPQRRWLSFIGLDRPQRRATA